MDVTGREVRPDVRALRRCTRTKEGIRGGGAQLRDVGCTLIPREEVVLSVYKGASAIAVRRLNERVGVPASRITEAVAVT